MGMLQDEFEKSITEMTSDKSIISSILMRIFTKRGIPIKNEDIASLINAMLSGHPDPTVDILEYPDSTEREIEITQEEFDTELKSLTQAMDGDVDTRLHEIVETISPMFLNSLYASLPSSLQDWQKSQRKFEKRHYRLWKQGLDQLEMLIVIAHESAECFVADLCSHFEGQASTEETLRFDTLVRLHVRACRISRAVLCLLKSGYADDAMARWRSVHEIAVISLFLSQSPLNLTIRYLDHAAVERWKSAKQYQQHCLALGQEELTQENLNTCRHDFDAVVTKYGDEFENEYGWASRQLSKHRPSFYDIEASLDMSHWRPYFKMACHSVHAGSQGLVFSLGDDDREEMLLLAGASTFGICDPGHCTATALTLASVALFTARPNLDSLVACQMLQDICEKIGDDLLDSHVKCQPKNE